MTTGTEVEEDEGIVELVGAIMVKLVVLKEIVEDCVVAVELEEAVTVVGKGIVVKLPIVRVVVLLGVKIIMGWVVVDVEANVVVVLLLVVLVVLVVWARVTSWPKQACMISTPRWAKPKTELLEASTLSQAIMTLDSTSLMPALHVAEQRSPAAKSATAQPWMALW